MPAAFSPSLLSLLAGVVHPQLPVPITLPCHFTADPDKVASASSPIHLPASFFTQQTLVSCLPCHPTADPDKVAAAQEVLDRVAAASPGARAVVREMGELIDGYIELVGCRGWPVCFTCQLAMNMCCCWASRPPMQRCKQSCECGMQQQPTPAFVRMISWFVL